MTLAIKKETPIKYHLNMHLMDSLLENESIIFELIKYIINDKKELTIDMFKFTSKTLKYVFGDKMKSEEFKTRVVTELKKMISKNLIVPKGKSMYISKELIEKFYKIE
jgi:hypothetical protein